MAAQPIDLSVEMKGTPPTTPGSSLEEKVKLLRSLRDQGLLTEDEYRSKVIQASESSK
jgi:hypothetical protein